MGEKEKQEAQRMTDTFEFQKDKNWMNEMYGAYEHFKPEASEREIVLAMPEMMRKLVDQMSLLLKDENNQVSDIEIKYKRDDLYRPLMYLKFRVKRRTGA